MATYTKLQDKVNNRKIQVESAVRDGEGKNIVNNYAKQDGYYEGMGVGTATLSDNFNTNMTLIDTTPYVFRTAGGSLEMGGQCKLESLVGGTVAWNQLSDLSVWEASSVGAGITYTRETDGIDINGTATSQLDYGASMSRTIEQGHKILILSNFNYIDFNISAGGSSLGTIARNAITSLDSAIDTITPTFSIPTSSAYTHYKVRFCIFDLTQMFGSTIADYVYGLEQNSGGAGVAWFKNYFPLNYYPYNNGQLLSVQVSGKKIVGFNAYNPATGTAQLLGGSQYQLSGTYSSISYVDINGNTETLTLDTNGLFTPTNNGTLTIVGGNNTDTCVNLYWDGERDGEYEEYTTITYPLSNIQLNGFLELGETDNNLYYYGDTYSYEGVVTRNAAFLTSQTASSGATITLTGAKSGALYISSIGNIGTVSGTTLTLSKSITNVDILYELATPTIETTTVFAEIQQVYNWGTEQYLDNRDIIMPVGHNTEYLPDLKAKLETVPEAPELDGYYVVKRENGINTYYSAEEYLSEAGVVRMKNITVNLTCVDGTIVTGQTITITDTDSGVVYTTATYNGQPVTIQVPDTFNYNVHYTDSFTTQGGDLYLAMTNNITGTAITDVTINGVYVDKLSQISTVADIKELLDDGNADGIQAALQKGRKLSVNTTWIHPDTGTSYTIPWNIVNVQTAYDSSGGEHTGVVIQMNYAFFQEIQFDAAENLTVTGDGSQTYQQDLFYYNSSYVLLVAGTDYQVGDVIPTGTTLYYNAIKDTTGGILRYGYNNYKQSAYRQWLNGVGAKGTWWTAQHVGDKAPSQLNTIGAFKGGFSTDNTFYPYLKEVRVRTALNTVTDSQPAQNLYEDVYDVFFLPSVTEMYGSANSHEGPYWEYWKQATGLSSPNNGSNIARKLYNMNNTSSEVNCWLRSPTRSNSYSPWYVNSGGTLGNNDASGACRCAPACIIY